MYVQVSGYLPVGKLYTLLVGFIIMLCLCTNTYDMLFLSLIGIVLPRVVLYVLLRKMAR